MKRRIVIAGAAGRMGRALLRCASEFDELVVTGATEAPGSPLLGQDAGVLAGQAPSGVAVTDDLNMITDADLLIDFTFHAVVPVHADWVRNMQVAWVLGTTGLTPDEQEQVCRAAERTAVLQAPNMSFAMNVLFELVARAAAILGTGYDAEIVEVHHRHKQDAPSGSALRLAQQVACGRKQDLSQVAVYGRQGQTGARPQGEIGVHAVRSGDVVGDHAVTFAGDCEILELGHRATSREAFARGALKAACWLRDRAPGRYDMRDVLGLDAR